MFGFSKRYAELRRLIDARVHELQALSAEELRALGQQSATRIKVGSYRPYTGVVVNDRPGDDIRVVVWGDMYSHVFPPLGKKVVEGFYKRADGAIAPIPEREFWEFD
jgi:hypothetical protein